MRFHFRALAFLGLTGACSRAPASATSATLSPVVTGPSLENLSTEDLGAEFRRLRAIRGHMSGGGAWNDDVDKWAGRKHTVMGLLRDRLGVAGTQRARVVEVMGEPDPSLPEDGPRLVYQWRGRHDYLWFRIRDEVVVESGWWMAGE